MNPLKISLNSQSSIYRTLIELFNFMHEVSVIIQSLILFQIENVNLVRNHTKPNCLAKLNASTSICAHLNAELPPKKILSANKLSPHLVYTSRFSFNFYRVDDKYERAKKRFMILIICDAPFFPPF